MCCPQFSLNLEVEFDNDPGAFGGLATNRKCTDIFGLLVMVLYLGTVIGLCVYCIQNSDVKKVLNGYDDSGNICGKNNKKSDTISFKKYGEDMEQKKYVLIKDSSVGKTRECIENCTMRDTILVYNHCVFDKFTIPFSIEMLDFWKFLLISWFLIVLFIVLTVLANKSINRWLIIFPKLCYPFIYIIFLLYLWFFVYCSMCYNNFNYFKGYLVLAIIVTIAFLSHLPILWIESSELKRKLSAQLTEEIWHIIHSTPSILIFSILSSLIIVGLVVLYSYGWIWLQSVSYYNEIDVENEKMEYVQYPIAIVTQALAIYAFFLVYEFMKGCQTIVVAGYVAQKYFAKEDDEASQPFRKSVSNLLRYHLGSICCGSLILPFCYVLRSVVNAIKGAASGYNKESIFTCSCRILSETCLAPCTCLEIFTQNGFTMTAIYGCSYCKGTIRAHKLISQSSFNLFSINTLGINPLEMLKLFALFVTSFISVGVLESIDYNRFGTLIVIYYCMISYIIIDYIISVYKVGIDTLFLCFCEDYHYNNGASKPYNMSSNFAEFIENANKYVDPVKWKEVADKWDNGPRRLY